MEESKRVASVAEARRGVAGRFVLLAVALVALSVGGAHASTRQGGSAAVGAGVPIPADDPAPTPTPTPTGDEEQGLDQVFGL
jgi:hypothetical protein